MQIINFPTKFDVQIEFTVPDYRELARELKILLK